MYLYFDSFGYLKEIINNPVREGAQNVNKVYIYVEPTENKTEKREIGGQEVVVNLFLSTYQTGNAEFKLSHKIGELTDHEGVIYNAVVFNVDDKVTKIIPYDKKRDLKYFRYSTYYDFVEITIPTNSMRYEGRVDCTINLTNPTDAEETVEVFPLDIFSFFVQPGVVLTDNQITQAQYSYLLSLIKEEKNPLSTETYFVPDSDDSPATGEFRKNVSELSEEYVVLYPHTDASVVFYGETTVEQQLSTYVSLSGTDELDGSIIPLVNNAISFGSDEKNLKEIHTRSIASNDQLVLSAESNKITLYSGNENIELIATYISISTNSKHALLDTDALTDNRYFSFPDKTGTFALLGDVVPYTGATNNVNLGNHDITARFFTTGTIALSEDGIEVYTDGEHTSTYMFRDFEQDVYVATEDYVQNAIAEYAPSDSNILQLKTDLSNGTFIPLQSTNATNAINATNAVNATNATTATTAATATNAENTDLTNELLVSSTTDSSGAITLVDGAFYYLYLVDGSNLWVNFGLVLIAGIAGSSPHGMQSVAEIENGDKYLLKCLGEGEIKFYKKASGSSTWVALNAYAVYHKRVR